MNKRQRTLRKDFKQSSSLQQDSHRILMPVEPRVVINNADIKLVEITPRIQAKLPRDSPTFQSFKKCRYANSKENEIQIIPIFKSPQKQVTFDCDEQPRAPITRAKARAKAMQESKSEPELMYIDCESGSEQKVKSKAKKKRMKKAMEKAEPEPIPSYVDPEIGPKQASSSGREPQSILELILTKAKHENESKQSIHPKTRPQQKAEEPKRNQPDSPEFVHEFEDKMSPEGFDADAILSLLDDVIGEEDPSKKIFEVELSNPMKQCNYCTDIFEDDHKLSIHLLMHHYAVQLTGGLLCRSCKTVYTDSRKFERHIYEYHEIVSHECAICLRPFPNRAALIEHYEKEEKEEAIYRCRFCQNLHDCVLKLQRHLLNKHCIVVKRIDRMDGERCCTSLIPNLTMNSEMQVSRSNTPSISAVTMT